MRGFMRPRARLCARQEESFIGSWPGGLGKQPGNNRAISTVTQAAALAAIRPWTHPSAPAGAREAKLATTCGGGAPHPVLPRRLRGGDEAYFALAMGRRLWHGLR